MTANNDLSEEGRLLAGAIGAAVGELARALQMKGVLHQAEANKAILKACADIRGRLVLPGSPEQRSAVAAEIQQKGMI